MATLQRLALRGTPKATKAAARYTPAGGAERCGMCRHFAPSSSCARIEGPVSAAGWCQLYSQLVTWRPRAGQDAGLNTGGVPAAGLDLSFMTPGSLDGRITFTRASTATYFDATGTMQTATANAPRWDYDPVAHTLNGLLIEEARTNSVLNSATLVTQSVTVTAVPWTLSFYGTGTVTKSGTATGALVGTGAGQRVSQTFTPTAGSLTLTVTGTVSNAQLEVGALATSYIPTTGATATRALDSAIVTPTPWFVAQASTLATEYMVPYAAVPAGGSYCSGELDDGTGNNALILRQVTAAVAETRVFASAVNAGGVTAGLFAANAVTKHASTFGSLAGNTVLNGGTVVPFTFTGNPTGINRLVIGLGRSSAINGWMRRVRYWPRLLSNTELQSVTT